MSHIGHPLVGDPVYRPGRKLNLTSLRPEAREALVGFRRQALHASLLGFVHPVTAVTHRFDLDIG
jgi:23S rRNA pseudouridine1911/1915/1917 synthase